MRSGQADDGPRGDAPPRDGVRAAPGLIRGPLTWYCYLLLGILTYTLNIQGNVIPFLQSELRLSYRVVSLHSAALALGMIVIGFFGDGIGRRLGRAGALRLGASGMASGAVLLCLAPNAAASIASCGLIGLAGAIIPSLAPAIISDLHPGRRDEAFAEMSSLTYAFAFLAPATTSLVVWLGLGWRVAVALGAGYFAVVLVAFAGVAAPEPAEPSASAGNRLPPPYWAFWCLVVVGIALEFTVLLWAPAYLERVSGWSAASAAAVAAGFALGVTIGRYVAGKVVARTSRGATLLGALAVTLLGFAIYWIAPRPLAGLAGVIVLGLGIGPLYPLGLSFALEAAKGASQAASVRIMLGVGVAILVAPTLLAALADRSGLWLAHLTLPLLVGLAVGFFALAKALGARAPAPQATRRAR